MYWKRFTGYDCIPGIFRISGGSYRLFEKAGVKLSGPLGDGLPEINLNIVAFNGPADCGHPHGYELGFPGLLQMQVA